MKLYVNGVFTQVVELELNKDILSISDSFSFIDVSNYKRFSVGDNIIIKINNEVQFSGIIEAVQVDFTSNTSKFLYTGRDNLRYLVDNYSIKTIQFPKNANIEMILNELLPDAIIYGDTTKAIKSEMITIKAGQKILDFINSLALIFNVIVTSDNNGNILITRNGIEESVLPQIEYGKNSLVEYATYKEDISTLYDNYVGFSQNSVLVDMKNETNRRINIGKKGKNFACIFRNYIDLKVIENTLHNIRNIKVRKSKLYEIFIRDFFNDQKKVFKKNTIYSIIDKRVDLKEKMNIISLNFILKNDTIGTRIKFESVLND